MAIQFHDGHTEHLGYYDHDDEPTEHTTGTPLRDVSAPPVSDQDLKDEDLIAEKKRLEDEWEETRTEFEKEIEHLKNRKKELEQDYHNDMAKLFNVQRERTRARNGQENMFMDCSDGSSETDPGPEQHTGDKRGRAGPLGLPHRPAKRVKGSEAEEM